MEARTFRINIRRTKPNRGLMSFNLNQLEDFIGQKCAFPYVVTFDQPDVVAGNHYHKLKTELLVCIFGSVFVELVDPVTKRVFENPLVADEEKQVNAILILPGIAHAVRSVGLQKEAVILVFSTGDPRGEDDIDFEVMKRDENHIFIPPED